MKIIKYTITAAILVSIIIFFPSGSIYPHGLEKEPEVVEEGIFKIFFQTNPIFPVTGKKTHFDIIIKNRQTDEKISNLPLIIEIHKEEDSEIVTLKKVIEEEKGHYGSDYIFSEKGIWDVHVNISGQELEKEFIVEVDNFGISGILRGSVILILIIGLILIAYFDCRISKKV